MSDFGSMSRLLLSFLLDKIILLDNLLKINYYKYYVCRKKRWEKRDSEI